ncbi:hypothetical protein EBU71_22875, partial [bacterium]|nr:hypothetical protein [Candidatus Elulimicrobium humile]
QVGDNWKSTVKENEQVTKEPVDFKSKSGNSTDTPDGELTTYTDSKGNVQNPAENTTPPPITPSSNPDVNKIIAAMQKKGYKIMTRPYECNIVGIRRQYEGQKYSNAFKDDLFLFFKTDNTDKWETFKFKITTMPGFYSAYEKDGKPKVDRTGKSPNVKQLPLMLKRGTPPNNGQGILMEAQYLNIFAIGEHCGAPAMKTLGPQMFYRDNSPGDTIKYTGRGKGYAGMLIHRGYPGGAAVNNWSEGCQVFATEAELKKFFKLCQDHKDKYGNKFHYTLMLERDL